MNYIFHFMSVSSVGSRCIHFCQDSRTRACRQYMTIYSGLTESCCRHWHASSSYQKQTLLQAPTSLWQGQIYSEQSIIHDDLFQLSHQGKGGRLPFHSQNWSCQVSAKTI